MTLSLQSACRKNSVHTPLECMEDMDIVQLSRAREPDDLDGRRIREAHHSGQIGCGERAVMTCKGEDIRLPV